MLAFPFSSIQHSSLSTYIHQKKFNGEKNLERKMVTNSQCCCVYHSIDVSSLPTFASTQGAMCQKEELSDIKYCEICFEGQKGRIENWYFLNERCFFQKRPERKITNTVICFLLYAFTEFFHTSIAVLIIFNYYFYISFSPIRLWILDDKAHPLLFSIFTKMIPSPAPGTL